VNVRPYGDGAGLVEVESSAEALRLHRALRHHPGVVETVPAARTLLVVGRLPDPATLEDGSEAPDEAGQVVLDVRYDGPDLADTADELGMSTQELVRRHAAADYVVGFCGFAPGFAYLTGLDPTLHVARLATPRTAVPAGAVGIAGEFTGVYPRRSPGGWRLLGTTDAVIWDVERDPPALLAPGTRVRFRRA
jgi:KipI family sensor histidine kinase inhibitor